MAVTVQDIAERARFVLQEVTADGVRWTNVELVRWLNEFYEAAIQLKSSAFTVNEEKALDPGTKQSIPDGGHRLIDVVRNTAGDGGAIFVTTRRSLDSVRRSWHADPKTLNIEKFIFDDADPTHFYVYPPAEQGAKAEIIYSKVPTRHDPSDGLNTAGADEFRISEAYAPVAVDYMLYRAFSKDASHAANLNRSRVHFQAYYQQLTGKIQTDARTSPNAPDQSSNPPTR